MAEQLHFLEFSTPRYCGFYGRHAISLFARLRERRDADALSSRWVLSGRNEIEEETEGEKAEGEEKEEKRGKRDGA